MKKHLTLLLAVLMLAALLLSACAKTPVPPEKPPADTAETTSEPEKAPADTAEAPEAEAEQAEEPTEVPEEIPEEETEKEPEEAPEEAPQPVTFSVYYGDENEMFGYADPFNRACMDFAHGESEIFRQTKLFANLRGKIDTLRTGFYTLLSAENGVISYMRHLEGGKDAFGRKCDGEDVIIIINSHDEWRRINLDLGAEIKDTLSGEEISKDGRISLDLAPLSYRLFTPERK